MSSVNNGYVFALALTVLSCLLEAKAPDLEALYKRIGDDMGVIKKQVPLKSGPVFASLHDKIDTLYAQAKSTGDLQAQVATKAMEMKVCEEAVLMKTQEAASLQKENNVLREALHAAQLQAVTHQKEVEKWRALAAAQKQHSDQLVAQSRTQQPTAEAISEAIQKQLGDGDVVSEKNVQSDKGTPTSKKEAVATKGRGRIFKT